MPGVKKVGDVRMSKASPNRRDKDESKMDGHGEDSNDINLKRQNWVSC